MTDAVERHVEPGSAVWWTAHRERLARRGPRAGGLTIERIVDEAIALVDAEGLDALTVRALTGRLGTSSATLYRHVAGVDELAVLVIDRVLGEVELPDPSLDPRARVVALSVEFRRVLQAHPAIVNGLRSGPLQGPNALRGASNGLASLLESGYEPAIAVTAYLALIDYVLGSVFFDSASPHHGQFSTDHFDVEGSPTSQLEEHRQLLVDASSDTVFLAAVNALLDGLSVESTP